MSKRIYITVADGTPEDKALHAASIALRDIPPEKRTGIVTFNNGLALAFNDRTKNLSMFVWKEQ